MVVGVFHVAYVIEIASGKDHNATILPAARRPGFLTAGAAISNRLLLLKHFDLIRGIRL
jgi:hypothetical protein